MADTTKIIIGSRGSKLALWQAEWVKSRLTEAGYQVDIKTIKTTGDKMANAPLPDSGVKGLFIKEIEEALMAGTVDVAVHSLKDLPNDQPQGLLVAAVPERADARDVLVSRGAKLFADLPPGARVGTSSLRRKSQAGNLRRDLEIVPVRGNLDTRLNKLERGDYDALIVAAAGLMRLGLGDRIAQFFSSLEICPAVGQGALAIEIREGDERIAIAVAPLDHAATHAAIRAERSTLRRLGGGCQLPIAAHAMVEDDCLRLRGVVASPDGSKIIHATAPGLTSDPETLGNTVADSLLSQGALDILRSV
ncbi:MAG TPA: hydroxymethylbilane synthase [Terriglobia bacterium]|nr:hydroxymethylbilane synthase [Terriglobia bacterium]